VFEVKKILLFLTILVLIFSVSGCNKKESETKLETETELPEKSSDCTFKAVVTEVNDAGMVVKPVPGSAELKSSDAIAIGKAAITDNSNPEIGDTYEIVYDGRILETYPAGLSNISRVVLVEKTEDNTNVMETEHVISYNLGDLAELFTETPEKAQSGNKVEIRTQVLYDAGIHLYLDGQELKISHYDSDYWGYSFIMPDKDVEITAEPYTYAEIWGSAESRNDAETMDENSEQIVKEGWQKVEVDSSTGSKKYISVMLPEDWKYEIVHSDDYPISDLTISIYPKERNDGCISIGYMSRFGVCGTGLKQEEIDFNGHAALKGIYDSNLYWEFIALQDEYRDCVVWNKAFDTWYGDYEAIVNEILETVEFKLIDRLLPEGDIIGITAKTLPEGREYSFSDIISIQDIREYFDTLTLESDVPEKPEEYTGMSWVLKFTYSDQSEETIYHSGNMFVKNEKGQWYKMKYDEAEKLEGILAGIEVFQLAPSDYKVQKFLDLLGERPKTYDDDKCYNIIPVDISEKYGFNVFKYDMSCASYLLYEGTIYTLGESFGGYGVTTFAVADLNKDGMKELYFTYSWGSGIHRSQVGYFDPATKTVTCFDYSNMNNDMSFYVDFGTLMVCNAEVRAESFVDLKTINLIKVGELRFEDDQIKLEPNRMPL
jgi:hypothetical protein